MVYLVFLWILNVIGLRGCIIADFFFRGKRVVGVNVRPCRGCCLVCGVVGRTPCQLVFQAGKCWWLSGQWGSGREDRVAGWEFGLECEAEWFPGSWMSRQRCAGRRGGKAEFPCGLRGVSD